MNWNSLKKCWLSPIHEAFRPRRRKSLPARLRVRLRPEELEDRTVPTILNLTGTPPPPLPTPPTEGFINGALFRVGSTQPGGSGVVQPFLRVTNQGNNTTEQGYNTNSRPVGSNATDPILADIAGNTAQYCRAIAANAPPIVNIGGVAYREFSLGINQSNNSPISLDSLQIFLGTAPNLTSTGFDSSGQLTGLGTLVYNMAVGPDGPSTVLMKGSGNALDYRVDIPVSDFTGTNPYIYLYCHFGSYQSPNFAANDGYEQWAIQSNTGLLLSQTSTDIHLGATDNGPPVSVTGGTLPLGSTVHDSAIVTGPAGNPMPTGTVTFTFYTNGTGTPPGTSAGTVTLVNGVADPSAAESNLMAGSYSFTAHYSGDSNYAPSDSGVETLTISKGTSFGETTILDAATNLAPTGSPGESVFDRTRGGLRPPAFTPTGTVTYTFAGTNGTSLAGLTPGSSSWTVSPDGLTWTETVALNATAPFVPDSDVTGPLPTGTYAFTASYSGDSNYTGVTTDVEPLAIGSGVSDTQTAILDATTRQAFTGPLGESVIDTATVTGNPTPNGGTVTYTFTGTNGTSLANVSPGSSSWTVSADKLTWMETVQVSTSGTVPNSDPTGPLPAGSYQFQAGYSGVPGVIAGSTSEVEPMTLSKGISSTATEILDAATSLPPTGTLGESVFDTATVTGIPGFTPTGTVTYTFTGIDATSLAGVAAPSSWTVSADKLTWTETVTLNADGTVPQSDITGMLPAGSYEFHATYSGDSNYAGFTSDLEPLDINMGTAITQTTILDALTLGPPTGVAGEAVVDTATVTGSPFTPTGDVTYTFTGSQLASLTPPAGWTLIDATTWTDTVALIDGLAPNSLATPALPTGSYQFQATYSGDGNYTNATSALEPLQVGPASSNTATLILDAKTSQPPTGALGEAVFDTATVSGSPFTPTGTVTYTFTGQLAGLTPPVGSGWTVVNATSWTDMVTLSGGLVPNSPLTPALPAGGYEFQATYSGDANYKSSTSAFEPLTINQGAAAADTTVLDAVTLGPPTGLAGDSVVDMATVMGSPFTPTGDVTYTFTGPQLAGLTPPVGWAVVDSTTWTDTVTLIDGLAPKSLATPPLPTGSYQFEAVYSGDGNYTKATSALEPLQVGPASSNTATVILDAVTHMVPTGTLGEAVFDTATVSGSPLPPTGTVTYTFTGQLAGLTPPVGSGWMVVNATTWEDTVALSGGLVPNSPLTPALPAGGYQFQASYSGDANYKTSTSAFEPLTINQANSATDTKILDAVTLAPPTGVAGESVVDMATVTGSPFTPTGDVTYTFTGPQLASLTPPAGWTLIDATTWTDRVTLSGGLAPKSVATPPLPAGSYQFEAVYSGDANYTKATSAAEPLNVGPGSSNTDTTILDAVTHMAPTGTLGEAVYDTATVSGSPLTPTGTVTYTFTGQLAGLTPPVGSGWTVVNATSWTDMVTLNSGLVPNSPLTPALPAGGYQFQARYSGDGNYKPSTSAFEPLTINQGSAATDTKILDAVTNQPATGAPAESVVDTATVTGSPFTPTGDVTYIFTGPELAGLTPPVGWTVIDATTWIDTVTLTNGLAPKSLATPPLPGGSYQFEAVYSGDANYTKATSVVEPLHITPFADVVLVKTANPMSVVMGTVVTYTYVVHNNGPNTAVNVVVTDPFPPELTFVSAATPSQGTFDPATRTWHVGDLAKGATATLQVTAIVNGTAPITNTATAGTDTFDPDLSNNVDSVTIFPVPPSKRAFLASAADPPANANEAWLSKVYQDLLNRPIDPVGVAEWEGLLNQGVSPIRIVQDIEASPEYRINRVEALYGQYLHRAADSAGLGGFVSLLQGGATVEQVAAIIAGSPEFFQASGGTNSGFLAALYQDGLGRPLDPVGAAEWGALLSQGVSRNQVALDILSSPEYDQHLVAGFYTMFLNRAADPSSIAWVNALLGGMRDETAIAGITASPEFFNLA
jgi:uncharacterized repeat protein (TIGR01451 family)